MFTTPKGLKIRLDEAFAVGVFDGDEERYLNALKTTEHYIGLPDMFGLIGFLVLIITKHYDYIFYILPVLILIGNLLKYSFVFMKIWHVSGLRFISNVFSYVENWFLDKIAMAIIIVIIMGWKSLFLLIISIWLPKLLMFGLFTVYAKYQNNKNGIGLTDSERIYINASCYILDTHPQIWLYEYKKYLTNRD